MSSTFLDSNVILYLLSDDARKANIAEDLLAQKPSISVQVLNEITSVCHRKLHMPWAETQALLTAVKANCTVVPLTVETHALGVQIAQQHQLSFYDAHIVSAAMAAGVSTLMSEDMHDGMTLAGLRIRNPFRSDFKLHYGDLSDTSNLVRIVQETQPDEIYNLGAHSHVAVSFESPEYTADVDAMGTSQ